MQRRDAGELASAMHALDPHALATRPPAWLPTFAPRLERERALREFDRSRVAARIRSHEHHRREQAPIEEIVAALDRGTEAADIEGDAPPTGAPTFEVPADAWPLARCDQRLTTRLRLL